MWVANLKKHVPDSRNRTMSRNFAGVPEKYHVSNEVSTLQILQGKCDVTDINFPP